MVTDWRDFVSSLEPRSESRKLTGAANPDYLQRIESTLEVTLPDALRSLLLQTDGVEGSYGLGLVWPSARILDDNVMFRTSTDFRQLYMPFDPLLFFGDAGNGDQFAYTIRAGRVRADIFVWNHENDSRTWIAPDLQRYLEWTFSGLLKV